MYDEPKFLSYVFPSVDVGAGNGVAKFRMPSGMKGRLLDVHLFATEAFNSVTTDAVIEIGNASDADAYATFLPGDLAAGACLAASTLATPFKVRDTDLTEKIIPADADVFVTYTAPTGGTPTGIATITVFVEAFK